MAPRKLTDADKQQILQLYRQSDETTSSLASRYGVSVSTVSRLLKQTLSDDEYEGLIQQKRAAGRGQLELELPEDEAAFDDDEPSVSLASMDAIAAALQNLPEPAETSSTHPRRQRRRSSASSEPFYDPPVLAEAPQLKEMPQLKVDLPAELPFSAVLEDSDPELTEPLFASDATVVQEALAATPAAPEITDAEEDFDDLDEDIDDDDIDEDDEDEDDDEEFNDGGDLTGLAGVHIPQGKPLRILPLSEASIPRTCYLVVDRSSELITRPLRDFADLGQIPDADVQAKTLPVFDNHRIAKRFMRRMQRVVKVPDGRVFQKVSPYLQAKGITRLLIDGQVYSLTT